MSRTLTPSVHSPVAGSVGVGLRSATLRMLGEAVTRLLAWRGRARQRADLADLTDHMLADIGITRAQAIGEAAKPFWIP